MTAIVTLECGCFFSGRDFIVDPDCPDHAEIESLEACATCGTMHDIDALDSKPEMTRWLRVVRFVRGQRFMLRYAADRGHDFTRLECAACYGPGYVSAVHD